MNRRLMLAACMQCMFVAPCACCVTELMCGPWRCMAAPEHSFVDTSACAAMTACNVPALLPCSLVNTIQIPRDDSSQAATTMLMLQPQNAQQPPNSTEHFAVLPCSGSQLQAHPESGTTTLKHSQAICVFYAACPASAPALRLWHAYTWHLRHAHLLSLSCEL